MTDTTDNLTDKQRLFVDEYLACGLNATVAAKRAGYSEKTAQRIGSENLSKPLIRTAIDARLAESAMSAGEVLHRLTEIARGSLADLMTVADDGTIAYDFAKLEAAGKLGLVKEIGYSNKGQMIVKLHDPITALDKLGRYHRLFDNKPDTSSAPDALEALRGFLDGGETPREQPKTALQGGDTTL